MTHKLYQFRSMGRTRAGFSHFSALETLLIAEPKMHVTAARFQEILDTAQNVGLVLCGQPSIRCSRSAVFEK